MLRKATQKDFKTICKLINDGKKLLKLQGINQWQHGTPNEDIIKLDIEMENSYVYEIDNNVIATAMINFDKDRVYEEYNIWHNSDNYAAIHRFVIDKNYLGSGFSNKFIQVIKEYVYKKGVSTIRIDTHENNLKMQRLLIRNDFCYCGEVKLYLEDEKEDKKRLAYDYIIIK